MLTDRKRIREGIKRQYKEVWGEEFPEVKIVIIWSEVLRSEADLTREEAHEVERYIRRLRQRG